MLRSMFTAISALNLHQSYLDVVANNLANANTTGYKANRFLFQDQYYQMINSGAAPTATQGGTNPVQIGLGVQAGYISPTFTQGALQSTGRNLDLAVQGNGFFIYNSGPSQRFSREGSLTVDANGMLVNAATGMQVQGWGINTPAGTVDTTRPLTSIQIPAGGAKAQATTTASVTGNLNSDLTAMPLGSSTQVTLGAFDSLGNSIPVTVTFTRDAATPNVWAWAGGGGAGTLTFDASGHLPANTTGTVTVSGLAGAGNSTATVNFSSMTNLAAPNSPAVATQNGLPAGTMTDVYVTPTDGSVFVIYSNGMREQVGQIATATFTNPEGLIASGHTMFQAGLNSGNPQIGTPNTGGRGVIASGYLEGSNVDMAQEFTNMILAQRGFQASSRVITTSDEIIQELVNLKR
jgi:flagellar hook protein FlgE